MYGNFVLSRVFCRLWDFIPAQHTGLPQWYVVHAWAGSFQDMVDALLDQLGEVDEDGVTVHGSKQSVILWLGEWYSGGGGRGTREGGV